MLRKQTEYEKGSGEKDSFAHVWFSVSALHLFVTCETFYFKNYSTSHFLQIWPYQRA